MTWPGDICTRWQSDYEIDHLAERIRDWRLEGCAHSLTREETCSPCLRDRFIDWLGMGDRIDASRASCCGGGHNVGVCYRDAERER